MLLDERMRTLLKMQDINQDADLARRLQEELELEDVRLQAERQEREAEDARLLQAFLDTDRTCELCGAQDSGDGSQPVVELEHCLHRVCSACAYAAINVPQATAQRDYVCPVRVCTLPLRQRDVKRLLSAQDFEKFVDLSFAELNEAHGSAGGSSALVKCPKGCGWAVMIDSASPAAAGKQQGAQWDHAVAPDGKPISSEAARHRYNKLKINAVRYYAQYIQYTQYHCRNRMDYVKTQEF